MRQVKPVGGSERNEENKSGGTLGLGYPCDSHSHPDPRGLGSLNKLTRSHDRKFLNRLSVLAPHIGATGQPQSQRQVLRLVSLAQTQGLLSEDKASLLLHRHHLFGQVVGL